MGRISLRRETTCIRGGSGGVKIEIRFGIIRISRETWEESGVCEKIDFFVDVVGA